MNYYNCIYLYINKTNNKKYVGQAKDFNKRHSTHIHHSINSNSKDYKYPFHKAIRKYGIENFKIIILKENLSNQCLMNLFECYYIKKYNTLTINNCGYNIADGGSNGNVFAGKTDEEIEDWKNKLRKPKTNKHKEKISASRIGKFKKENNPRARKIAQYDLNGNLIKVWNSIIEASEQLKINKSNIGQCCRENKRNHAGGFVWRYVNDNDNILNKIEITFSLDNKGENNPNFGNRGNNNPNSIPIIQYDLDGNLIKVWDCIKDAGNELNLISSAISSCCIFWSMNCNKEEWFKTHKSYPRKSVGGFIWKYKERIDK